MGLYCARIALKTRRDLRACSPREIRRSEIAFEAILGQKQTHSIGTWLVEQYCIQFSAVDIIMQQLTSKFHERNYYSWQNSRWVNRW